MSIYLSSTGKAPNSIFFRSSILVQMVFYFSNSLSWSIGKRINLLFLFSYPRIFKCLDLSTHFRQSQNDGLITSYKYPVKYLDLFFGSTNLDITKLPTLTSFYLLFYPIKFSFSTFALPNLNIILLSKTFFAIIF